MKKRVISKLLSAALAATMMVGMYVPATVQASEGEVPTLVWWTLGNTPADDFEDAVAQISDYTEEKIGVRMEVKVVNGGEYEEKMNTIVNSGEYFDIMWVDNRNYSKFVELGAFANLTDLVQSTTPELYSFIPEGLWDGVMRKGNIYSVPTYKDSSRSTFWMMDETYVEKYGVDMKAVQTMADMDPIFRAMKEGEGNGFYAVQQWVGVFDAYDNLSSTLDAIGVKFDDDTRKVVCTLEQEDIMESLTMLHEWYVDGIIHPDANVITETLKGMAFNIGYGWPSAESIWENERGVESYILSNEIGDNVYTTGTICGSLNAISSNSEYQEEALKLLELINTDSKLRDMLAYGTEGTYFEYTEEGTVKRLRDDWAWPSFTQGTFFIQSIEEGTDAKQWDEIKAQNESAVSSPCLGFALDLTNIQNEVANCNTVFNKYKTDMLTGASDPADAVPACVEELKAAGLETIISEAQKQVDEFFK